MSNSEASWANSSSSSGSSCSWTWVTLTWTSTSSPTRSPPTSWEVNVVSSPALMPASASSRPSSMPPRPTLVGHAADLGALDGLAVLGGDEVDHDEVAVGGRHARRRRGCRSARAAPATCSSTSSSETSMSSTSAVEAVVVGQRDLGPDVDLGGELEGLVVLELGDLDLRLRQRLEVVVLQRLDVLLRQRLVDRLVEDGAAADLAVDDRRRHLALAEAGDVDLLGDRLVRRVEARLELLEGHLDGQLGPGRAQGLDGALHGFLLVCVGCDAGLAARSSGTDTGVGTSRVWQQGHGSPARRHPA